MSVPYTQYISRKYSGPESPKCYIFRNRYSKMEMLQVSHLASFTTDKKDGYSHESSTETPQSVPRSADTEEAEVARSEVAGDLIRDGQPCLHPRSHVQPQHLRHR